MKSNKKKLNKNNNKLNKKSLNLKLKQKVRLNQILKSQKEPAEAIQNIEEEPIAEEQPNK